eukprot:COSAG05_NODE_1659_length_4322_cov_1019.871892_4_plen_170_part_00
MGALRSSSERAQNARRHFRGWVHARAMHAARARAGRREYRGHERAPLRMQSCATCRSIGAMSCLDWVGIPTPKVKIQVIDLEHLIAAWRGQIKSGPPPMHFSFYAFCARKPVSSTLYIHVDTSRTRALATRHPASCPLAAGQARARAGWLAARVHPVSLRFMHDDACMI